MLRIHQSTSQAAAKSYYAHGLSKEDYYSEGQELTGLWGGKAAQKLGLSGEVEKGAFDALCENTNPATGARLTARTDARRTVGYDFNFNAPKSVSVLYGLTEDKAILTAFRDSVNDTMRQIEHDMQTRVRKGGREETRTTGNLIYAEFVHFTARPVNGVSDPHLHAHCYTFNATYDEVEQQWKAGQFQAIKRDAPYFEACFHARLAENLSKAGYSIERHAKGWEVAGLDANMLAKYSQRTAVVTNAAADKGITGAKGKDQLAARTREGKHHKQTMQDLRGIWQERLTPEESSRLHAAKEQSAAPIITEREAMDYAIAHGFERASVMRERELQAAALRYGVGSVSVDGIGQEAGRADLLRQTHDGQRLCTTREVLAEEQAMIALVRDGRGQFTPLGDAQHPGPANLSREQQSAVAFVASSRDLVTCIEGRAGVGKTTLMRAAVDAIEASGKSVHVFAPTAQASRGVLKSEGFSEANTVAHLLNDKDTQAAIAGQVIWIDEAGLMGASNMRDVLQLAQQQNARVVLSGDTAQHGSVARGDSLRMLQQEAGLKTTSLSQIHRQSGSYKQAVEAISKGDLDKGFATLDEIGAITELPEDAQRYAALARAYGDAIEKGKTVLAVSPTHHENALATEAIRQELRARGQLAGEEKTFTQHRAAGWTEAERGNPRNYQPGQIVQFHQNAKGIKRGERFTVESVAEAGITLTNEAGRAIPLPMEQAGRFQVYEAGELGISTGDRLRITQNGFSLPDTANPKGHRLNNGAVYNVAGFTKDGDIKLSNGWTVAKDYGSFSHGFCSTSHASQGATVDHVLIAESSHSFPAASREQWYVSVSRGRQGVQIFTDDKHALREAVTPSAARVSATELTRKAAPELPHRMARLASLARSYGSRTAGLAKGWLVRYQPPWTKPATPTKTATREKEERGIAL